MAKYFYANTWHPELFSKMLNRWDNNDQANTVEYLGKKWCRVPNSKIARIEFNNNQGLREFYLSFEFAEIPVSLLNASDMYRESNNKISSIRFSSYLSLATTNTNSDIDLITISRQAEVYNAYEDITVREKQFNNWKPRGTFDSQNKRTSFGLENTLFLDQVKKVHIHFTMNGAEATTSVGKGAKRIDVIYPATMLSLCGVFIRNIIISEEPISYSDTIREVTVDSITGNGWYTSNGKSFTENVNNAATVKLNSQSLAEAKRVLDARKFAFSGITNRQGERINALEVKRANEAHQSFVDIGEHTFGSSWNVNSPNEISDTLTITTRKVVGK